MSDGPTPAAQLNALNADVADLVEAARRTDPDGRFSVWIGSVDAALGAGRPGDAGAVRIDETAVHYAASTMKLAVADAMLLQVDAGAMALEDAVDVHTSFRSQAPGDLFTVTRSEDDAALTWDYEGRTRTLGWLAEQMISWSSNLATNLVMEVVGGGAAPDAVLQETSGPPNEVRRFIDDRPASAIGIYNHMTAAGMAALLAATVSGRVLSATSTEVVRGWLAGNGWNDQIPAGLPDGVVVEHKNGWDTGIRHDCGVVRPDDAEPYVVSVYTTSALDDDVAQRLIADISRTAWGHRTELGQR